MDEADVTNELVNTTPTENNKKEPIVLLLCKVPNNGAYFFHECVVIYAPSEHQPRCRLYGRSSNSTHIAQNLTISPMNDVTTLHNTTHLYNTISNLNKTILSDTKKEDMTKSNMLNWEKSEVAVLLSVYFYASVITQIPSGVLATKVSGKLIISIVLSITAACSLLVPVCARTSIYLVFVIRIILGFCGGTVIPVGYNVLTSWAPPSERAFMISFTATGALVGSIISYVTSGFLCEYGFDGGWPSIFYIQGILTALSVCLWMFDSASTPSQHRRISPKELKYLKATIVHSDETTKKPKTPWRSLLTSMPLWAVFAAHCALNWSFFSILINVPLFMKEVLKFDIKQNGVFSAMPYVFSLVSILISGKMANIVDQKLHSPLVSRRLFTAGSLLGSGVCLVLTGYMTPELRYVAVALLCIACCFFGLAWGGFFINHPEFAGRFAAIALSITNTGGIIMASLASMSAGLLTPNSTQSEWQRVFYISGGLNVFGTVMFSLFSSVSLQSWAAHSTTLNVDVEEKMIPETKLIPSVNDVKDKERTDETNI